jgi:hypothetical protein
MSESLPLRALPFDHADFDWDRFERFCLAVVGALPDVVRAGIYGDRGEDQQGIDIEVDLVDGRKRTIQCRHRKKFGIGAARDTVQDTEFVADEHAIWVTGSVSAPASKYIDGLPGWSVLSGKELSLLVRELPRERSRIIVRDAFGDATRRAFLGPDGPIGFVAPDDYFADSDARGSVLSHTLPLVGHADQLAKMVEKVRAPGTRAVVLPGRGGIGKTRLLRAAAAELQASGKRVLFATDVATLTAAVIDDLPRGDVVVVVDDAHRSDASLAPLMAATKRPDSLTILLATRPSGVDGLQEAAIAAGLEIGQLRVLPQPTGLSPEETIELAISALGEDSQRARDLAAASSDAPLVAVVGGRLLARGQLVVDGTNRLREEILARFIVDLRGRVTPLVPPESARTLMTLVAAFEPLDTGNAELMARVADDLEVSEPTLRVWLGELQAAGLVLERARLRRLTPEVLADELLAAACFDRQGNSTGRATELWERYGQLVPTELLRNLSEMEWRRPGSAHSVLDRIWHEILERFDAADAFGREQLIDVLTPMAAFAPKRALELVDHALDHPANSTPWLFTEGPDDRSVRRKLPQLLRQIGGHDEFALAAVQRLWELGRDDDGRQSDFGHPLYVLREVGGYKRGRAAQHQAILDLIDEENARAGVEDHATLPIEICDALLSRSGSTTYRDRPLSWKSEDYFVSTDATAALRAEVRTRLLSEWKSGSARRQVSVARVLREGLRLTHGSQSVPEAIREQWRRDEILLLELAANLAEAGGHPAARVALQQALKPYASRDEPWPDVQAAAAAILSSLHGIEEIQTAAITTPWDIYYDQALRWQRDLFVARNIVERASTPDEAIAQLERRAQEIIDTGLSKHPAVEGPAQALMRVDLAYAKAIWRHATDAPQSAVSAVASRALDYVRAGGERVDEQLAGACASADPHVRCLAASYISDRVFAQDLTTDELAPLAALLDDEDSAVRHAAAIAVLRLGQREPRAAALLALEAKCLSGTDDSSAYLLSVISQFGVEPLTDDERQVLVERLVSQNELKWAAMKVVTQLGVVDPERAIDMWLGRLSLEANRELSYRAVPFHNSDDALLEGAGGEQRIQLLMRLLSTGAAVDGRDHRSVAALYWRIAVPGLPDDEPDEERIAAAATGTAAAWRALLAAVEAGANHDLVVCLLTELPWQVLLTSPAAISELLDASSEEIAKEFSAALEAAGHLGFCGRTIGEDSKRWTSTQAHAHRHAAQLPRGARARGLWRAIEKRAMANLNEDRRHDQELRVDWQ